MKPTTSCNEVIFGAKATRNCFACASTRGPGPEFEADERLVVLVEAGEDIALDVIPVQNRLEVGPDRHPCTALRLCGLGRWRVAPAAAGWTLSRWACIEPWTGAARLVDVGQYDEARMVRVAARVTRAWLVLLRRVARQSLAEQMHGDRVGDLAARCDRFALVIQVADPRLHAVLHDAGWNLEHGPEHQRAVRALADRGEILWKVRDWVTVPVGEIGTVDRGDVEADRVAERDKVPGPGEVVDFFTDGRVAEPIRLAIAVKADERRVGRLGRVAVDERPVHRERDLGAQGIGTLSEVDEAAPAAFNSLNGLYWPCEKACVWLFANGSTWVRSWLKKSLVESIEAVGTPRISA